MRRLTKKELDEDAERMAKMELPLPMAMTATRLLRTGLSEEAVAAELKVARGALSLAWVGPFAARELATTRAKLHAALYARAIGGDAGAIGRMLSLLDTAEAPKSGVPHRRSNRGRHAHKR